MLPGRINERIVCWPEVDLGLLGGEVAGVEVAAILVCDHQRRLLFTFFSFGPTMLPATFRLKMYHVTLLMSAL